MKKFIFGMTEQEWMNLPDDLASKILCKELTHDISCGEICYDCNTNEANGIRVVYKIEGIEHPTAEMKEEAIGDLFLAIKKKQPAKKVSGSGYNKKIQDSRATPICEKCHKKRSAIGEDVFIPHFVSYLTLHHGKQESKK